VSISDAHASPISASINAAQSSFSVSPNLFAQLGTHTLTITLSDGDMSSSQTIDITVVNDPPYFTVSTLPNKRMPINSTLEVSINDYTDTEGHAVTMTYELIVSGVAYALPAFATASGTSIVFSPISFETLGLHTFKVSITDSSDMSSKNFDLEIFNTAPYFTSEVPVS